MIKISKNILINIITFIYSYIAILALFEYSSFAAGGGGEFLFFSKNINTNTPAFLLLFLFFPYTKKLITDLKNSYKNILTEIIYGTIVSLLILIGYTIYNFQKITYLFYNIQYSIFLFFAGAILWILTFYLLKKFFIYVEKNNINSEYKKIPYKKYVFILLGLLLFLVYFNCFLAYYPGIFSYDSIRQLSEINNDIELSNLHPVAHTMFLAICIKVSKILNINFLAIYSLIQIVFLTFSIMFIINKMYEMKLPSWILYISYVYYLLIPTFHIFSFSMTKDIFFSGFVLLFIIYLFDTIYNPNNKSLILAILFGILCIIFRTNMVIITFAVLLILYLIKSEKQFKFIFLIITLFFFFYNYIFLPFFNIKNIDKHIILAVPTQQLANLYVKNYTNIDTADRKFLKAYIPNIKRYNPHCADLVIEDSIIERNFSQFSTIYLKYLNKYPIYYFDGFLNLNINYWYIFQKFPDSYTKHVPYIETEIKQSSCINGNIERRSKNKKLFDFYENIAKFKSNFMRLPIFYQYFLHSFCGVFLLIYSFIIFKFKKKEIIIPFLVMLFIYIHYLFSPICIYRYLYPIYLSMPILTGFLFINKNNENINN